jgi:hypothetical protein
MSSSARVIGLPTSVAVIASHALPSVSAKVF